MRKKPKQPWAKVRAKTRAVGGERPGQSAAEDAVNRVEGQKRKRDSIVRLHYGNCCRKPLLPAEDKQRIVDFSLFTSLLRAWPQLGL